jgi:hypothetical protein
VAASGRLAGATDATTRNTKLHVRREPTGVQHARLNRQAGGCKRASELARRERSQ